MRTYPALIVQSAHAAALTQGVPLASGTRAYKTAECRGLRCLTSYRGSVAIFASNSYSHDVEDHYVWFLAHAERRKRVTPQDDLRARAWCQYTYAWRYRLIGFVTLTGSFKQEALPDEQVWKLAERATDYKHEWIDDTAVYLTCDPLHDYQLANTPKFGDVCAGCNSEPKHNPAACHVNFQTVRLADSIVPNHVIKECAPWPQQAKRR